MHSVLDILLGGFLTVLFLLLFLPATNFFEDFLIQSSIAPFFSVVIPIILIVFFPLADIYTPTRGDTTVIAAVFSGIEFGSWINYQFGWTKILEESYPLSLGFGGLFYFIARTVVGLAIVALTEFLGKLGVFAFFSAVVGEDRRTLKASENSLENTKKNFVDLLSKFITYFILGFNCLVVVPKIFELLHIDRPRFFSEF